MKAKSSQRLREEEDEGQALGLTVMKAKHPWRTAMNSGDSWRMTKVGESLTMANLGESPTMTMMKAGN